MSYFCYLCLLAHSGVQYILRCILFSLSSSCLPYVSSFSGLSIFDCRFGILWNVYLITERTSKSSTFSVRLQPFGRTLTTKLNIVLIFFQIYMCEKIVDNTILVYYSDSVIY